LVLEPFLLVERTGVRAPVRFLPNFACPLASAGTGAYLLAMPDARHIVCPHCDAVNRVPAGKPAAEARCGVCHQPLFSGHPSAVRTASFGKHIGRNDVPVVVDFWADWCGPCKMMAPVYERVTAEVEPDMRFLKVDTEREPELATRYNIRSIPTLMVFRGGKIVARRAGAVDAGSLRAWLKQAAAECA
jgi:thioredoxin 2